MTLTDSQLSMARHALGLDGKRKQSYRNRFFAGLGHADFLELYLGEPLDAVDEHLLLLGVYRDADAVLPGPRGPAPVRALQVRARRIWAGSAGSSPCSASNTAAKSRADDGNT